MKFAILTSLALRPPQSCVARVTWTLLYTLNHSGWWSTLSARRATRLINPNASLKSLKTNSLYIASRSFTTTQPGAKRPSVECCDVITPPYLHWAVAQAECLSLSESTCWPSSCSECCWLTTWELRERSGDLLMWGGRRLLIGRQRRGACQSHTAGAGFSSLEANTSC